MPLNREFKIKNDLNVLGRILSGGKDLSLLFTTNFILSTYNSTFRVSGDDALRLEGINGIDVRATPGTETVTISGIAATTTERGVASFNTNNFIVTDGAVSVKTGGISNNDLAGGITNNKLANSTITFAADDDSTAVALGGLVTIQGTGNQITTTNTAGTINIALPSTLVIPGSISVLNGQTTVNDINVNGNLFVSGSATFANTTVTSTSALSVINTGPSVALYVKNLNAAYDVASFIDGDGIEVLHVGNSEADGRGRVGINTSEPTVEGLTVNGAISASDIIFTSQISTALHGGSKQWYSVYTTSSQTSALWDSVYTTVSANSAGWNSSISDAQGRISALEALSASWNSVYTSSSQTSALWDSVYTTVSANSAGWNSSIGDVQGRVSALEAASASWNSVYTSSSQTSALWNSVYTTVSANSAGWNSSIGDLQGRVTTLETSSGLWNSVYITVSALSAYWDEFTHDSLTDIVANSGRWDSTYTSVRLSSGLWDSTYTSVSSFSARDFVYTNTYARLSALEVSGNTAKSVVRGIHNITSTGDFVELDTFDKNRFNSIKYLVQIKNTTTNERVALEVLTTKNVSTWEGTVYGIVDQANLLRNVEVDYSGLTVQLEFTLNGTDTYTIISVGDAITD